MWINGQLYTTLADFPLEELHTKQLLKLREHTRPSWKDDNLDEAYYAKVAFKKRLFAELATREHVPNKQEARKKRQERHKKGK